MADEKVFEQHFDDLADFLTLRPAGCEENKIGGYPESSLPKYSGTDKARKWFGCSSAKEVEKLAREGWPEGVKRIYDALGKIGQNVQAVSIKRRLVRADQGDEYDIHRAYAGGLDQAWTSRKRQARIAGGSTITLAVSVNQSSGDHADMQFWRGAACVRLADILTEAGYQVRIVGFSRTTGFFTDNTGRLLTVTIKESGQQLDLSNLAATVALAGTYRHFGLRQGLAGPTEVSSSFGSPVINHELAEADLTIRKADVRDRASAEQFIERAVEIINERIKLAA